MVLDLALRLRVHALMQAVEETIRLKALRHHRSDARHPLAAGPLRHRVLPRDDLIAALQAIEDALGESVRHRGGLAHRASAAVVERSAVQLTIDKYMSGVRADAPWCPSNIEFIRRINGLDSIDDVQRIVFDANYLVLGLGRRLSRRAGRDAGRSAPPAGHDEIQSGAHLDAGECRRHRRRLSVHLRHGGAGRLSAVRPHHPDVEHLPRDRRVRTKPWLLRFFDQIRFYPVADGELLELRDGFPEGAPDRDRTGAVPARGLSRFPRPDTKRASPPSRRASRPPSTPSGSAGRRRTKRTAGPPARMQSILEPGCNVGD